MFPFADGETGLIEGSLGQIPFSTMITYFVIGASQREDLSFELDLLRFGDSHKDVGFDILPNDSKYTAYRLFTM